jgi:hypothetical protein
MAASAPTPPTQLKIVPPNAEINADSLCHFTVEPAGTEVSWEVKSNVGRIDASGNYVSPSEFTAPQSVTVTATAKTGGQVATATVQLKDNSPTISWLGRYAVVVAGLIGILLLSTWSYLYQQPAPPIVVVSPPIVTLNPKIDKSFKFAATVLGDSNNAVTWSVDQGGEIDSTGNFRIVLENWKPESQDPKDIVDRPVTITARSVADPTRTGVAVVHLLSDKHLEVIPALSSAFPSQQGIMQTSTANTQAVPLVLHVPNEQATWSVSRSDISSITSDGVFRAGRPNQTSVVQVTAWGRVPHEVAAVAIIISASPQAAAFKNLSILIFVITCGALGSMVYFSSSFVAYVGNRTFRSSWLWFYISRPFVGGALAVIFFFLIESGMISGVAAFDLMKIGLISALVGLFSDKAVKKLSDVLDVLLATKDDRKDKIADSTTHPAATTATTTSTLPTIASIDRPSVPANTDALVEIKGSNFKSGFKVKVNGQDIAPTDPTEQSFKLTIPAAQVQGSKLKITITTDQGSVDGSIDVTQPTSTLTSTLPTIASIDRPSVPANTDALVEIKGTNFTSGFKVKVNGQDITPIDPTEQSFKLQIPAAQVLGPKLAITVTTDQGPVEGSIDVTPSTSTPSAPALPTIVSIEPKPVPANTDASLVVTGVNFTSGFKVKVNGQDITPVDPTEQSFKLQIPAAQVLGPKLTITVTTDQGPVEGSIDVTA